MLLIFLCWDSNNNDYRNNHDNNNIIIMLIMRIIIVIVIKILKNMVIIASNVQLEDWSLTDFCLSRVCLSHTNPSGVSWRERVWADDRHERSDEGQEDCWFSGFWDSLCSYCLHRHYWENQVSCCVKECDLFNPHGHLLDYNWYYFTSCLY